MAKKNKRKSKSLLPKRIAGVKVPKSVRKGRLGDLLASRTGQALLAEAVMAAGAAAVAKRQAKDSAKTARRFDGQPNPDVRGLVALAFTEAASAFIRTLGQQHAEAKAHDGAAGVDQPERPAAHWASDDVEPGGSKKNVTAWQARPV